MTAAHLVDVDSDGTSSAVLQAPTSSFAYSYAGALYHVEATQIGIVDIASGEMDEVMYGAVKSILYGPGDQNADGYDDLLVGGSRGLSLMYGGWI